MNASTNLHIHKDETLLAKVQQDDFTKGVMLKFNHNDATYIALHMDASRAGDLAYELEFAARRLRTIEANNLITPNTTNNE